jgi:hypothetical protein
VFVAKGVTVRRTSGERLRVRFTSIHQKNIQ